MPNRWRSSLRRTPRGLFVCLRASEGWLLDLRLPWHDGLVRLRKSVKMLVICEWKSKKLFKLDAKPQPLALPRQGWDCGTGCSDLK